MGVWPVTNLTKPELGFVLGNTTVAENLNFGLWISSLYKGME